MGLAKARTVRRRQSQDMNPDASVSRLRLLDCRTQNQNQWGQGAGGSHLKRTPGDPYLGHRKHESARAPQRHRCHQNLRPWKRGHEGEMRPRGEGTLLPRPGDTAEPHSALRGHGHSLSLKPVGSWVSRLWSACAHWMPSTVPDVPQNGLSPLVTSKEFSTSN